MDSGAMTRSTGTIYKACLYQNIPDWVVGWSVAPENAGPLIVAVSINDATRKIDIAVDSSGINVDVLQRALVQVGIGLKAMNGGESGFGSFSIGLQTQRGTMVLPVVNKVDELRGDLADRWKSKKKSEAVYRAYINLGEQEWIVLRGFGAGFPATASAAVLIDTNAHDIYVAVDEKGDSAALLEKAFVQIGVGMGELGVDVSALDNYRLIFQTNKGTTFIPTVTKQKPPATFWDRIFKKGAR